MLKSPYFTLATILVLALGAVLACDAPELAASASASISRLELKDLDGKTVKLSDYQGKVLVLNFWATWCPPCLMELPHFKEAYEEFRNRNVEFLGASLDATDPHRMKPAAIGKFAEDRELGYPIMIADKTGLQLVASLQDIPTIFQSMEDSPTREAGTVSGIPTTFFIDSEGKIHHKYVGYMPKAYLVKQLEMLLNES